MAALIKSTTGADAELVEGGRGEFTVWVGDRKVAEKTTFGFPDDTEVAEAVKAALA